MNARRGVLAGVLALALGGAAVSVAAAAEPVAACGSGYISGQIVSSLAPVVPVVDAIVEATPSGGSEWAASTRTASDGSFSLGCLDPGTWYDYWADVDGGGHSLLFALTTDTPGSLMYENDGHYIVEIDLGSPTLITSVYPAAPPSDVVRLPASPSAPVSIALPQGVTRPVQLVAAGPSQATTPSQPLSISANGVELRFAASTLITSAASSWDGRLAPPAPTTVAVPAGELEEVSDVLAIEVGSAAATLTLDRPARLAIPGAAGRSAGFVPVGGSFTPIVARCMVDSASGLGSAAECVIDVGPELVIWTTHFTAFAVYSSTAALAATGPADLRPVLGWALLALLAGGALLVVRGAEVGGSSRGRLARLGRDGRPRS
ncbi:MAG: hypothetical protein BGO95_04410 [Micrococcales bacterium 73-13]|nr:MAG: hypothetical protein BGO95_04410 [Micrococcales bacterium 73-13]